MKDSVRDRVLNTAVRLFYHQGYLATGINQIIEESSIAKATLYQQFTSKEELCIAYLKVVSRDWFNQINVKIQEAQNHQKLDACFEFLAESSESSNFRGCHFLNIISEVSDSRSPIVAQAKAHKQELRLMFHQLVKELPGNLSVRDDIGDIIYLLFEGAIVESQTQRSTWPIDVARKVVSSLIKPKNTNHDYKK